MSLAYSIKDGKISVLDLSERYKEHLICLRFDQSNGSWSRPYPCNLIKTNQKEVNLSEVLYLLAFVEKKMHQWVRSEGALCNVTNNFVCVFANDTREAEHLLINAEFDRIDDITWKKYCPEGSRQYVGLTYEDICKIMIKERNNKVATPFDEAKAKQDPVFTVQDNIIWVFDPSLGNTFQLTQVGFSRHAIQESILWTKCCHDYDQEALKKMTFKELMGHLEKVPFPKPLAAVLKIDLKTVRLNDEFLLVNSSDMYILAESSSEKETVTAFGYNALELHPDIFKKVYPFPITDSIINKFKDEGILKRLIILDRIESVNEKSVSNYLKDINNEIKTSQANLDALNWKRRNLASTLGR